MEQKKLIIILTIILIVVIAGAGIFWFFGGKDRLTNLWNKYIVKKERVKELVPLNPTDEEKKIVENKTDEQIKNDFESRKGLCLEDFGNGKMEEAINKHGLSKERAESYFECAAISQEDISKCDVLGENSSEYKKCRQNFLISVKFAFPALRGQKCDSAMIDACKESGTGDCENVCSAIISDSNRDCSDISSAPQRAACWALEKGNISPCDSLKQEMDKQFCKFAYFLTLAAKSNNPELLSGIETKESYLLAKLYFDVKTPCQELASYMGETQCPLFYNENYLNRLLEIGRDLRGDYINQPTQKNN